MKHVLIAIGSLFGGGAERVVSIWANELIKREYNVSIVLYARTENEYEVSENVHIYPIANTIKECDSLGVFQRLKRFRKIIKSVDPDVIISFLPIMQIYIMLATFALGIKRIETVRINPWMADINNTKFRFLWKLCFATSDAVILQSSEQKEYFSKEIQNKSIVISNPLNPKIQSYKKNDYHDNSFNVIAAGRLSKQKNYRMMIDAVKIVKEKYPDTILSIFGDGPDKDNLIEYIASNQLENAVFLKGRSDIISEYMMNSDLFLMSSDYEGLPNSLIEAMAIGVPCISTDCKTGPKDLIENGYNGFLVPTGNAILMAEAIGKVFDMDVEEKRVLGSHAKDHVESLCNTDLIMARLCCLIDKCLD